MTGASTVAAPAPMLARLEPELPEGPGWVYEPKWDGFRCLAFVTPSEVALTSRHGRPLERYFPEVAAALRALPVPCALDGELLVEDAGRFDFGVLLERIHPAASRVERLAAERPACLVAFDLLAVGSDDLMDEPFCERRRRLELLLAGCPERVAVTPATEDADVARAWLDRTEPGIDGVVAKRADGRYAPGARELVKVKRLRTADCVVAGARPGPDGLPSSLLLGLYAESGALAHVGVAASFSRAQRERLAADLTGLVTVLAGHPWEHGFLVEGGRAGRLKGAAGRWVPGMTQDWVPLAPRRVCEVAYDRLDGLRWRHPARFLRWRPDREPLSCRVDQLVAA